MEEQKLSGPLWTSAESARPKRAEAWRNRRSLQSLCTNLRAIQHLYATVLPPRLRITPEGMRTDDSVSLAMANAGGACLRLSHPIATAVSDPEQLESLARLRHLVVRVRERTGKDLAEALGLRIGFNNLDGD